MPDAPKPKPWEILLGCLLLLAVAAWAFALLSYGWLWTLPNPFK